MLRMTILLALRNRLSPGLAVGPSSFSRGGGCAITVPPWNMPSSEGAYPLWRSQEPAHPSSLDRNKGKVTLLGPKMFPAIVPCAPSGLNPGAAS
jgi:hypothetical protein